MNVELQHLTKIFPSRDKKGKEVVAVSDFTFTVPDGELIGLLGPSGCGKSTTLYMLSGLEKPTSGRIFFGPDDVTDLPAENRGVGLVFQNYALYPHLTVEQNIRFPLENLKGPDKLTKEQMKLYLQLQNQYCTDNIIVDNGLKLYLRFQDVCNGYEPIDHGDTIDENGKVRHNIELKPLADNPKLDMLEEVIDDIGDKQVVVWCSRTKLLYDAEAHMRELGYTTAIYDGKIDKKLREEGYQSFSEGKTQLIFVNQASGAYGLDGLKEADYAVYLCNSYSVEQRAQSENRIYRGEITRSKYIIDIICKGTCEDRVTEALKQGKELLDMGTTDVELFKYYGD